MYTHRDIVIKTAFRNLTILPKVGPYFPKTLVTLYRHQPILQKYTQRTTPTHYPGYFAGNPLQGAEQWVSDDCNRPWIDDTNSFWGLQARKLCFKSMFIPRHTKSGGVLCYTLRKFWVSARPSVRSHERVFVSWAVSTAITCGEIFTCELHLASRYLLTYSTLGGGDRRCLKGTCLHKFGQSVHGWSLLVSPCVQGALVRWEHLTNAICTSVSVTDNVLGCRFVGCNP